MPLGQRLTKLGGFKNPFKRVYAVVNLTGLNRFADGATIGVQDLYETGLARPGMPVKLLGAGELRRRLEVSAHAVSDRARSAVEAKGGRVTIVEEPARPRRRTARG